MPRISKEACAQGGHFDRAQGRAVRLPYDDYPPLPAPDQSRYGPAGTTDSPRMDGFGRLVPETIKGDSK